MKGSSYLCSQITQGVENAGPIQVDIPCTSRKDYDLSFEAVLQEYLKFPYVYFLLVVSFRGYFINFVLQTTPGECAGQVSLLIILSPKTSDKAYIDIRAVWAVAESC
jgi:hypothetical protein